MFEHYEQVQQPVPGVEIPFLQDDNDNPTRQMLEDAKSNYPESSVQNSYKARVAKWP